MGVYCLATGGRPVFAGTVTRNVPYTPSAYVITAVDSYQGAMSNLNLRHGRLMNNAKTLISKNSTMGQGGSSILG